MQNASTFLTAVITSLKHPTSIAAFASVGMHAALGIALPSFSLFAADPFGSADGSLTAMNQVGMVELDTQAAINRLPLNVIAPTPSANSWNNSGWGNNGLDSGGGGLPTPTLGSLPGDDRFTAEQFRAEQFRAEQFTGNALARAAQPAKPTPPQRTTSRAVPQGNTRSAQPPMPPQAMVTAARNQHRERGKRMETPPDNLQSVAASQQRTRSRLELFPELRLATETFRVLEELENPADLLRRERTIATDEEPVAIAPQMANLPDWPDEPEARIRARQNALRTQTANTTQAEADENNARWLANLGTVEPRVYSIAGNYPPDACLRRLSGTSSYGATVQPNGAVGGLQLIRSSGYGIFDRQAKALVEGFDFANVTRPTPFKVNVTFSYSPQSCPGLAVPNGPSPTPRATPQPSPTPEATLQPSPSPTPEAAPETGSSSTTPLNATPSATERPASSNASDLRPDNDPTPANGETPEVGSESGAELDAERGSELGAE